MYDVGSFLEPEDWLVKCFNEIGCSHKPDMIMIVDDEARPFWLNIFFIATMLGVPACRLVFFLCYCLLLWAFSTPKTTEVPVLLRIYRGVWLFLCQPIFPANPV